MRLAIPTTDRKGLRSHVAAVFARAPTFTYIDVIDEEIRRVEVEENPARNLEHGAGPIVAKLLKERGIDIVATDRVGPGASTLLEMSGIKSVRIPSGIRVSEAVRRALEEIRDQGILPN
ncbi:dinitrogenase iron-molybdenum cofactor [Candidatus Bathyarchaeota archaeon]|nr:MAG: dinitrogenase iron-molybdenum cofactor [Candidatus Bathyarchaeota archaeon]